MVQDLPLSKRDGKSDRDFDALHEGAPLWLRDKLAAWVDPSIAARREGSGLVIYWRDRTLDLLELDLQRSFRGPSGRGQVLLDQLMTDQSLLLDVVDWLLRHPANRSAPVAALADVLTRGKSVWQVRETEPVAHLERRVAEQLTATAQRAMSGGDTAGVHLRTAWEQAWGLKPDADAAYSEAVKAVEAVLIPVVTPKNARATLGNIITGIKDKPDAFSVNLAREGSPVGVPEFMGMLGMLWRTHKRHGEPDAVASNSIEETRDAVGLAALIVDWVQRGSFARATAGD